MSGIFQTMENVLNGQNSLDPFYGSGGLVMRLTGEQIKEGRLGIKGILFNTA